MSEVLQTLAAAAMLACHALACAQDLSGEERTEPISTDSEAIAYKLTTALYHTTNQRNAFDINVRGNLGAHTGWVGFYKRHDEFQQARVGYETTISLPWVRVTPSVQYASRGFLGGSANAEIGERHFALLGISRTNLKDYFNLTFDPNDSILIGAGTRALPNTTVSIFQIRDNRLNTGQRVLHFVARTKSTERTRWTVDVFYKEGHPAAGDELKFHGTGASVTYDFDRYFVRFAFDPHVNFTPNDMVRFSAGVRF